jgi:hypothetical protein
VLGKDGLLEDLTRLFGKEPVDTLPLWKTVLAFLLLWLRLTRCLSLIWASFRTFTVGEP